MIIICGVKKDKEKKATQGIYTSLFVAAECI